MSVIKDSLGELLGVRGMQKWGVLFPRTLEVTHLRQWLTLLKKLHWCLFADRNLRCRPKT